MRKAILAGLAMLLLVAVPSFGQSRLVVGTPVEYTAGKANADSLGTAADTLTAFRIPVGIAKLVFVVMPDTADVIYWGEIANASTGPWSTAFVDTAVAGGADAHELGAPTGSSGGYVANVDFAGMLPGQWARLRLDNIDATIDYCEIYTRFDKYR
jgi:hypothetical protein